MKKIILIFCLGFILNSCAKDPIVVLSNTDANVIFNLKSASLGSRNASTSSVGNISDITIFVFEKDGNNNYNYLYRKSEIIPVDNKFTANILLTNNPVKIHIFANPNDEVNSVNYNGKTESEVINSITTDLDLNNVSASTFPMHSSLFLPNIVEDLVVTTDIYLLRAMALVDINASAIIDEKIFKLEGASVYHTPSTGRWVSDYRINDNPTAPIVTASTIPTSFTTITATPNLPVITDKKMEGQLFIYENSKNSTPPSRIVVSGIFNNNGTTTYYPLDFTGSGGSIDVLRNHRYTINITDITGSGYTNPIDAANGESIDISADIIAWNSIVIDGSVDTEVQFNAPSKVLLDHTSNNGSYVRTVAYKSNKDVKLFVNGIEVLFPTGSTTSVDLDIPAEQNNWLTTATWNPTDNLEGEFIFTHSTSNYNNPESYIVTLKSGGITRNIEVFVNTIEIELEETSNCYFVPMSGKNIIIPTTDQINVFWAETGDGNVPANVIDSGDEWYAEVIWADFDFDGKVIIEKDGTTASNFGIGNEGLGVTIGTLTKPGNVIIGLKKKGASTGVTDYLWSWHLWITDYDPNIRTNSSDPWAINKAFGTTGGQVHSYADAKSYTSWMTQYNGAVVMDRNLGATVSTATDGQIHYQTAGLDASGMLYQWGRKDPYPPSSGMNSEDRIKTWGVTSWNNNILGPKTKAYSVNDPHIFIGSNLGSSTGDWQPQDDDSWMDAKGTKSLYDPCPDGWRVIPMDVLSNFETPPSLAAQILSQGTINCGVKYTSGSVIAWYPGIGGILSYEDGASGLGSTGNYWTTATDSAKSKQMYFAHGIISAGTLIIPIYRSYAYSVRCLKE